MYYSYRVMMNAYASHRLMMHEAQECKCKMANQVNKAHCWAAGSAALGGISHSINVFQFEDDTLERAGLLQSHQSQAVPPFLVVASNDLDQVGILTSVRMGSCWRLASMLVISCYYTGLV